MSITVRLVGALLVVIVLYALLARTAHDTTQRGLIGLLIIVPVAWVTTWSIRRLRRKTKAPRQ